MRDSRYHLDPAYEKMRKHNPALLPSESLALLRKFQGAKRKKTRDKYKRIITNGNQGLVISIARKYCGRGVDIDDLVQEGCFGLMDAVERFSFEHNTLFSTYATRWIRQKIMYALIKQKAGVCVSRSAKDSQRDFRLVLAQLIKAYGRNPTPTEIALNTGMNIDAVGKLLRQITRTTLSFEDTFQGGRVRGEGSTLEQSLASRNVLLSSTHLEVEEKLSERRTSLAGFFGLLEIIPFVDRDRKIFKFYYGLSGYCDGCTLEETGKKFRLTRERVRQINADVWRRLALVGAPYGNEQSLFNELEAVVSLQNIIGEVGDPKSIRPLEFSPESKARILDQDKKGWVSQGEVPKAVKKIIFAVAEACNLSYEEMRGRCSGYKGPRSIARPLVAYLIREDLGRTCREVTQDLGAKTFGYASSAHTKIKKLLEFDNGLKLKIENIRRMYLPFTAEELAT